MKVLEEKYPMGSLKRQKTAGRYIDGYLYENLEIMAEKIVDDMTFLLFIYSSTLEVGTGKSVLASQIGEVWVDLVNKKHNQKIEFDMQNCVFKPKDLIERSFKLPKYSCIILDEWEDSHYWSELGMSLRQFFRKCRQLNLLIICIIPNFFQLPSSYAISRSIACIDVKFSGNFERGYFSFYSFKKKKDLYINGKRTQNYKVVAPDFSGRFADGYGFNEKQYRYKKYQDMINSEKEEKKPSEKDIKIKIFQQLYTNLDEISIKRLALGFGISERTGNRWLKHKFDTDKDITPDNINYLIKEGDDYGEKEIESE